MSSVKIDAEFGGGGSDAARSRLLWEKVFAIVLAETPASSSLHSLEEARENLFNFTLGSLWCRKGTAEPQTGTPPTFSGGYVAPNL